MSTTLTKRPDVLVVGTRVAGALVAYRAARAGLRVTMLDCGPRFAARNLPTVPFVRRPDPEGLSGEALREAVRHRAARRQVVYSFNEQLPDPSNRIYPSERETDALSLPRP